MCTRQSAGSLCTESWHGSGLVDDGVQLIPKTYNSKPRVSCCMARVKLPLHNQRHANPPKNHPDISTCSTRLVKVGLLQRRISYVGLLASTSTAPWVWYGCLVLCFWVEVKECRGFFSRCCKANRLTSAAPVEVTESVRSLSVCHCFMSRWLAFSLVLNRGWAQTPTPCTKLMK